MTHLVSAAEIVCCWGCEVDTVVATLLHDVVEDTEGTLEEIEYQFGKEVAMLVDGATKVEHAEREVADMLTQNKISTLFEYDKRIAYVKLADRIHNLSTLSHLELNRQKRIIAETLSYYVPLAARLGDKTIMQDLDVKLRNTENLA